MNENTNTFQPPHGGFFHARKGEEKSKMKYASCWKELEEIEVLAIADVHVGSPESKLKKLIDVIQSASEQTFFIFLGDILDNAIIDSVSDVYAQTMSPEEALHLFSNLLDLCGGRVLGVVSGNHELRTRKRVGVDILGVVCEEKKVPYSPNILVLDVAVGMNARRGSRRRVQYTIACGHGYSSARGIGAKVTANGRIIDVIMNADIYLTAHTHQPSVVKLARFEADTRNKRLFQREAFLVTVPSWVGYEHYAAQKFMHPTAEGYISLTLSGTEKKISVEIK